MNIFQKIKLASDLNGYWNRVEKLYKENGMKLTTNFWIQLVAMAGQAANQFGGLLPAKWQPWIMLGLGTAQGVVGIIAHNVNPDGTPATTAYVPAVK